MSRRRGIPKWIARGIGRRGPVGKATQALAIAKRTRRQLSYALDVKSWRVDATAFTSATAGAIYLLSGIAQGDDDLQRIGNKIMTKRILFQVHAFGDILSRMVRVILFVDKAQHGTAPAITDLLEAASYTALLKSVNVPERFRILMDRTMRLSGSATDYDAYKIMTYKRNIRIPIHYIGDSAASGSMGKNTLYVAILSQTAGTANKLSYQIKLSYTD